ncbi:hypothetical protein P879_06340 [Paragonimus westermani]|uniref:SRCR domain-containing protein n=1 Tax=Paragonimus westermani TaxID=34504 RepID=A0A8T0D5X8_9TREM|nr:hypothetical protein P879_06340 [Paragonimus westermani]
MKVVCQELGQPTLNAIVRTSRLYDFQLYGFENPLVQKHVWMESYVCHGFETHRHQCIRRLNYDSVRCLRHQEFVFLRCAALPSGPEFTHSDLALYTWGNVRIVLHEDENDLIEGAIDDKAKQSVLEYVLLERAGLLHGQRVAALTTVYAYPRQEYIISPINRSHGIFSYINRPGAVTIHELLSFINITNCFGDGFELITPSGFIGISNTSVSGCLGRAISMTVLNGDSTDPTTYGLSSTQTLGIPTLPPQQGSLLPPPRPSPGQPVGTVAADLVRWPLEYYPFTGERHLLGFVPMCAGEKTIDIVDRLLNTLELYNGANFNTSYLIAEVTAKMLDNHSVPVAERFTFVTSSIHDILGVHLHTSPASGRFGFIAEVITLPISPERTYPELNKQMRHRIEVCEFQANQGGGIHIQSVGENGPDLYLANLRFIKNGLQLLNLTGPPAVEFRLTNTFNVAITNSYFFRHLGHVIRARLHASQVTRGTRMNITNNAIVRNRFGGALLLEGNHFNTLLVIRNYIAHNDCGQRDLVRIAGVLARPFAYNFIHDNRGAVLLNCSGEEQLSHGSRFEFNGFYKNEALNYTRRTTVFSDNSKNQFRDNYFKNNANSYELVVGNRSIIRTLPIQPGTNCPPADETCPHGWTLRLEFDACLCYRPDSLDARLNWWGDTVSVTSDHRKMDGVLQADGSRGSVAENRAQSFARSRIYDEEDDPYLIRVDYTKAYVDNSSVLGPGTHCPPTWEFNEFNCFYYFGIPMSYSEAHEFCLTEVGAILATSRSRIAWLTDRMSQWQHNYAWINRYTWVSRAWIYSEVPLLSQCPTTRNGWLEPYECEKRIPFFCQKGQSQCVAVTTGRPAMYRSVPSNRSVHFDLKQERKTTAHSLLSVT